MENDNRHIAKPFLPTLIDTVEYARLASTVSTSRGNLLAKAAILHSALSVEALANNLMQFIALGRHLGESVDRLDVVAKIELFALLLDRPKLDRGSSAMQVFAEFVELRNRYVHPKMIVNRLAQDAKGFRSTEGKAYHSLCLKTPRHEWCSTDSSRCVIKLVGAVDELLLDHFKLEMKSLSCMFCDSLTIEGTSGPMEPDKRWCAWLERSLHCRPRFFMDHIMKRFQIEKDDSAQPTSSGDVATRAAPEK